MRAHVLQYQQESQTPIGIVGRGFNIKYPFTFSFIYSLIHSDIFILLQGYVWSVWPGSRTIGKYTE